jgi:hypothetical protein
MTLLKMSQTINQLENRISDENRESLEEVAKALRARNLLRRLSSDKRDMSNISSRGANYLILDIQEGKWLSTMGDFSGSPIDSFVNHFIRNPEQYSGYFSQVGNNTYLVPHSSSILDDDKSYLVIKDTRKSN